MSLQSSASRAANIAAPAAPPLAWAGRAVLAVLGALLALSPLLGCEEVKKGAEEEQKIAAEQAVIRAYAARVPDVDQKLAAFLAAWERANEQRDLKALKDDLAANVKPAVAAHLEALAAMPTGSPELAAIHAPLVLAYREAAAAFDTFITTVTDDTLDAEYTRLIAAMDRVSVAEDTYFAALEAHFAKHRMTLTPGPEAPKPRPDAAP
ncbi:MAG TPA: hypothetical protein PK095_09845 [Myxococcota bacterium]|nr:hypothetical protein [Myxococcota bacterium]